jgi:hypothetical protein
MAYYDPLAFTDRMELGKVIAQELSNRGRSIGKGKVKQHRPKQEDTEINRLWSENKWLHSLCKEAQGQGYEIPYYPDDFNAQPGSVGTQAGSRLSQRCSTRASEATPEQNAMTLDEYHEALIRLKLSPCSIKTAKALGLSVRQLQRIAAGETPVSETIALLLRQYVERYAKTKQGDAVPF